MEGKITEQEHTENQENAQMLPLMIAGVKEDIARYTWLDCLNPSSEAYRLCQTLHILKDELYRLKKLGY